MTNIVCKYLIVGGGITGLSFAWFLNSKDYLLIEKEEEVGGYCRTKYAGEYTWDYAGHFFHFQHPEIERLFLQKIPKDEMVYNKKNTKIYYKGNYIDYPFQNYIHQLEKDEFIECLVDLYEIDQNRRCSNFKEMLISKFGEQICEKFLFPYNEKLYACKLEELDADAMGRFFPYVNFYDVIHAMKKEKITSYNDSFYYPKKGAVEYINIIKRELEQERIMVNTKITRIDPASRKAYTGDGEEIVYEYLINTMPWNQLMTCMHNRRVEEYGKRLKYNKVLVLNLGFNQPSENKEIHWMYIPCKEVNFYRIGFYNNILHKQPLSIYVEIGFDQEALIDIENELEQTIYNLKKLKIIKHHQLVDYDAIIMDPAYVLVREKDNAAIRGINEDMALHGIHTIGRYGGWKYCSIEDCIVEAKNLAERFNRISEIGW